MSVLALSTTTAQVFVTTYAIGNRKGFACGKWFDLSDFADKDDFLESATEYAINELGDNDPELCFSDYDNIPSNLIHECGFDDRLFEFLELSDNDKEIVQAYMGLGCSLDESLDEALNSYVGYFETAKDLGYHMAETMDIPEHLEMFINYETIGEYHASGLMERNGHYFHS